MFKATVYCVLVKSAENTREEEYLALKALESWNANQGESKGIVFIPVKPINGNSLLPEVDVLIGIVGSYILDQDFFRAYVKAGKKVFLSFSSNFNDYNSMRSEVLEVEAFKKQMETLCSCVSYSGSGEFVDAILRFLDTTLY